jgi:hypothetical protein
VAVLADAVGGAYVEVWNGLAWTWFFVGADGRAQREASGENLIPARGSRAVWTLTGNGHGGCTLRLVPSSRPPLPVPCGSLQLDTAAGLLLSSPRYEMVVDSSSGRVVKRVRVPGQIEPINGSLVLENSLPSVTVPGKLTLVDLSTGARRSLPWPSNLPTLQRIAVEPHGPLIAVGFVSDAYPGPQQANDIWLLNTATGTWTHLPDFPAQESIKASDFAWTSNDRLVVIAETNTDTSTRVVLGIWQPGHTTLPLRAIPNLAGGYAYFAPISG